MVVLATPAEGHLIVIQDTVLRIELVSIRGTVEAYFIFGDVPLLLGHRLGIWNVVDLLEEATLRRVHN